jgi:hypothetical protein
MLQSGNVTKGAAVSVLSKMSEDLLIDKELIAATANGAAKHYKRFEIKSGRIIWQPSSRLKLLQYWVVDFMRSCDYAASSYATAYEPGCNILKNAKYHARNNHLLRMDVRHFFPSIGSPLIIPILKKLDCAPKLSNGDIDLIMRIVLLNDGLTIGAPSSPFFANRAMIPVDKKLVETAIF